VVLGYLSIGFAAGVVQRASGLSVAEVMLMSLVLYAGSAQFVAASLIAAASPPLAVIATVFFVNLRHLLLSAALAPYFARVPAWKNALIGAQLTDETFVVALGRLQGATVGPGAAADPNTAVGEGARSGQASPARRGVSPAWMAGLNLSAYTSWAAANLAGALAGGLVSHTRALGFDFALPAMFAALLVLQLAAQANRLCALAVTLAASALSVGIALALPGNWNIIIATLAGASLGAALELWTSAQTSS
jgi:predicted branched-subunit amino acid permease